MGLWLRLGLGLERGGRDRLSQSHLVGEDASQPQAMHGVQPVERHQLVLHLGRVRVRVRIRVRVRVRVRVKVWVWVRAGTEPSSA